MVGRTKSGEFAPLVGALLFALLSGPAWAARTITISTATGGVTVGAGPSMNFGNGNGLGVGTPSTGVTVITGGVTNGALYTSPYNITVSGFAASAQISVTAYVVSNFTHPTILIAKSCQTRVSCTSAGNFTTVSTNSLSPTQVTSSNLANGGTATATVGIFVSAANGSGIGVPKFDTNARI
jgi:hypothetical protein